MINKSKKGNTMRKNATNYCLLFIIGGIGYCLLELLWRGFTDPSMGLAGGISFCMLGIIQQKFKPLRLTYRCILGGLTITAIEMCFGLIFNIYLKRDVWDYSQLPLNLMGQICLLYTVIWCILSAPMLKLTDYLRKFILRKDLNLNSINN